MTALSHRLTVPSRVEAWTKGRTGTMLGLVCALTTLFYMMRPAFRIKFGIIDDHDIPDIIGRRSRLPPADVPAAFTDRWNEPSARFRPLYWVGRSLETATAGLHPSVWYFDRFLLAATALVAIYLTAARFMAPLLAAPASILPFLGAQFETWNRLGPAESYAFPLLCVGLALLVHGHGKGARPANIWLSYLFLTLAGLVKENFILVSVVCICSSVLFYGMRKLIKRDWWVVGVSLGVNILALGIIAAKTLHYGAIYPGTRNMASLKAWYAFAMGDFNGSAHLKTGLLMLVTLFLLTHFASVAPRRVWAFVLLIGVSVVLQSVFYAGSPQAGRYLYPLALLSVCVWGAVGALCRACPPGPTQTALTAVIAVALILFIVPGIRAVRASSEAATATTTAFNTALAQIEAQAIQAGASSIVLQPSEPLTDIERVLSLARFISTQTDLQVMTLPATHPSDAFSHQLANQLRAWSQHGEGKLLPYRPSSKCLSIVFGSNPPICPLASPSPG